MASPSSPSSPTPIPATVIAELEARRRDANLRLGLCGSGCSEVDEYVLLGGLERGCVVGVSCEDEGFGVTVCFSHCPHVSLGPS